MPIHAQTHQFIRDRNGYCENSMSDTQEPCLLPRNNPLHMTYGELVNYAANFEHNLKVTDKYVMKLERKLVKIKRNINKLRKAKAKPEKVFLRFFGTPGVGTYQFIPVMSTDPEQDN